MDEFFFHLGVGLLHLWMMDHHTEDQHDRMNFSITDLLCCSWLLIKAADYNQGYLTVGGPMLVVLPARVWIYWLSSHFHLYLVWRRFCTTFLSVECANEAVLGQWPLEATQIWKKGGLLWPCVTDFSNCLSDPELHSLLSVRWTFLHWLPRENTKWDTQQELFAPAYTN